MEPKYSRQLEEVVRARFHEGNLRKGEMSWSVAGGG